MSLLKKYSELILFLSILSTAIFFRLYKLSTIPFGLNNDSAWEGSAAIQIMNGNIADYLPYAAEGWRGEGIVRAIVAYFTIFFGNDPITIKLSTVIFGIALVIVIYVFIKRFFGYQLALLTSFFIAISGWHITFSKTGWRAVTVPFFTTLIFYFLFKGFESKKPIHFILSGAFLSIVSLYTYDAARAIPILFAIWIVIEFLTRKKFIKTYGKNLIFLFISCIVVSAPMLYYAFNNFENFKSRSDFLFIGHQIEIEGNITPLINNITTSLLLFNDKANGNDFFIFEPLVDFPVSLLIPIGLLITLLIIFTKKNKYYLFMVVWFLVCLLPGILSVPNGNRAIGTIPSVYFFAAVGIWIPAQYLIKKYKDFKSLILIGIILFCLFSAFGSYRDYLGPQRRELAGFYPETLVTTNYIKTIIDTHDIYLTDNYPRELLTYYLYRGGDAFVHNYTWVESNYMLLDANKKPGRGIAFFMFAIPENEAVANSLLKKFPKSHKFYLWYDNDNIHRQASLVVKVNP